MPGSLRRFGPAKAKGEARCDQTGSTRMLRPAVWISQLACPTNDSRALPPSTRAGGVSAWGLGAHSGHTARWRLLPNCQRSTSLSFLGGTPSGSKKTRPSKWSEGGLLLEPCMGSDWQQKHSAVQGGKQSFRVHETASLAMTFLDFWSFEAFKAAQFFGKNLSFRPADRPRRPEVNARQRDAPSGANVFGAALVRQSVGKAGWHSRSADATRRADGGRCRRGDARGTARAAGGRRLARRRPLLHRTRARAGDRR